MNTLNTPSTALGSFYNLSNKRSEGSIIVTSERLMNGVERNNQSLKAKGLKLEQTQTLECLKP